MKQNYVLDIDFQTYNSYNSMHFNRLLAHAIGAEESLIYASLISKYYYYESHILMLLLRQKTRLITRATPILIGLIILIR